MPSPESGAADLLASLGRALDGLRVRWYVFGAQAALIWGRPRLTADVDVTVRMEPEDPTSLVQTLERAGFRLRVDPADAFVARTRVLPFVHLATGLPLDVVLGGSGLEDVFASRAVPVLIGGRTVPVIRPEDLIVTKMLAGRPKDLDDVRGVLGSQLADLDLDLVRATLRELEEALGQSDLTPAFDAEVRRAGEDA